MKTPKHNHEKIEMRRRTSDEDCERIGDFYWHHSEKGRVLILAIPYHNGKRGNKRYILSEWTIDHKNDSDAQWSWDGNEDKPSLKPSLHAVGIWHGWIKKGEMIEA